MPGNSNDSCDNVYSFFETEKIKEMITKEMLSEETPDLEYMDALLKELKKRDAVATTMSPEESLEEFRAEFEESESQYLDCAPTSEIIHSENTHFDVYGKKRRHLRRIGVLKSAACATIIFSLMLCALVVAQASGLDVFGAVARWTNETFSFTSQRAMQDEQNSVRQIPAPLKELEDVLSADHISNEVLPTYIPEGFESVDISVAEMPESKIFVSLLSKGNESIILQYEVHSTETFLTTYEKDGVNPQKIEKNGIKFYVMTNMGSDLIAWQMDNVECSVFISNAETEDYLIDIINSISGGKYG